MTIMRPRMVQHVNTGQLVTLMHFLVEVKKTDGAASTE